MFYLIDSEQFAVNLGFEGLKTVASSHFIVFGLSSLSENQLFTRQYVFVLDETQIKLSSSHSQKKNLEFIQCFPSTRISCKLLLVTFCLSYDFIKNA